MIRKERNSNTVEEFTEGAVPVKRIIWGRDPYPSVAGDDGQNPRQGPVALLDLTDHALINITDLARQYRIDVPDGEGPTSYAWEYWNEPGNYLVRLTLSYELPVALEFSIVFQCASPDHWTYLRWIAENDGMVPLADDGAFPIPERSDEIPRTILLVQVVGVDELAIWLGGIKTAEAEVRKGERLSGLEVIMAKFEGKRYLSFSEIASALSSWLEMPYEGTETLILEALDGHESVPVRGISPQLKMVLQEVAKQENVGVVLLGGIAHMIRLDWLDEIEQRDLERTGKRVRNYFASYEDQHLRQTLEEFSVGTIPVVRCVMAKGQVNGPDEANSQTMPVALLDLLKHPDVDLRTLSQLGVFDQGAATEFAWAIAGGPDDILVRLTCTYNAPTRGQFTLLFSFLQHNAYLRWLLEHDNQVPLADTDWMEQQESDGPQVVMHASDDNLAKNLRIALIDQTLTFMSRPPSPQEMVRILFGVRRFLSLQELVTIADQMWEMPTRGNEEVRIPNAMEGPQAHLRAQHLSHDFHDLLLWLLSQGGITSGFYKGEVHLFTNAWLEEQHEQPKHANAGVQTQRHAKRRKRKKGKRPFAHPGRETPITLERAPDPTSPMGQATLSDGTKVRTYPYLYSFVRPLVPGEFEGHQVVSEERMKVVTHVYVTRIDPTTVARTRIPITTEQAEMFQAFGVLDRDELQEESSDAPYGPFSLPEETQHLTIASAASGVLASFQDYPRNKINQTALEVRAKQLAELRVRLIRSISNDLAMYARLFVPAFVFGYRLGHTMLQEISHSEQAMLLQGVCSMTPPAAQLLTEQILRDRMNQMQVESIYELLD